MSHLFVEAILADTPISTELSLRNDWQRTAHVDLHAFVDPTGVLGLDRSAETLSAQYSELSHRLQKAREELADFKSIVITIRGKFSNPPKRKERRKWDSQLAELVHLLAEVKEWDTNVAHDAELLRGPPKSYAEFAEYHNALVGVVQRDAYISTFVLRLRAWITGVEIAVGALSSDKIKGKAIKALWAVLSLRRFASQMWPFQDRLKVHVTHETTYNGGAG